jgi:hypothetical protein
MTELWREINGFLDYKVSTFGRVMSCKFGKEKILKYSISRGYRAIVLCKNKKQLIYQFID